MKSFFKIQALLVCMLFAFLSPNLLAQDDLYLISLDTTKSPYPLSNSFYVEGVIDERPNMNAIGFVEIGLFDGQRVEGVGLKGGLQQCVEQHLLSRYGVTNTAGRVPVVVGVKQLLIGEKAARQGDLSNQIWVDIQLVFYIKKNNVELCQAFTCKKHTEEKSVMDLTDRMGPQIETALKQCFNDFSKVDLTKLCTDGIVSLRKNEEDEYNPSPEDDFLEEKPTIKKRDDDDNLPVISLSGSLGYSYLKIDSPDANEFEKEVNKHLSSGVYIQGDLQYFHRKKWGFGLQVNRFASSVFYDNILFTDTLGNDTIGIIEDHISISSFLVSVTRKFTFNSHSALLLSVALGTNTYKEKGTFLFPFDLRASGGCSRISLDYKIEIRPRSYIGLHVGYGGGPIYGIRGHVNNQPVFIDTKSSTNRPDFGVFIGCDLSAFRRN